jgi:hypothetical protein
MGIRSMIRHPRAAPHQSDLHANRRIRARAAWFAAGPQPDQAGAVDALPVIELGAVDFGARTRLAVAMGAPLPWARL